MEYLNAVDIDFLIENVEYRERVKRDIVKHVTKQINQDKETIKGFEFLLLVQTDEKKIKEIKRAIKFYKTQLVLSSTSLRKTDDETFNRLLSLYDDNLIELMEMAQESDEGEGFYLDICRYAKEDRDGYIENREIVKHLY